MKKIKNLSLISSGLLLATAGITISLLTTSCAYKMPITFKFNEDKESSREHPISVTIFSLDDQWFSWIQDPGYFQNDSKFQLNQDSFSTKIITDKTEAALGVEMNSEWAPQSQITFNFDFNKKSGIDPSVYYGLHDFTVSWYIEGQDSNKHIASTTGTFEMWVSFGPIGSNYFL